MHYPHQKVIFHRPHSEVVNFSWLELRTSFRDVIHGWWIQSRFYCYNNCLCMWVCLVDLFWWINKKLSDMICLFAKHFQVRIQFFSEEKFLSCDYNKPKICGMRKNSWEILNFSMRVILWYSVKMIDWW